MTAINGFLVESSANQLSTASARSTYSSGLTNQVSSGNAFADDTFLKLLSAQLQYQDPTQSMDNTQMILQMAQFAVIEQMSNLNTQFSNFMVSQQVTAGATVAGKEVTIALGETGEESVKGVVQEVAFNSSGTLVKVDGKYYEFWRIVEIRDASTTSGTSESAE